MRKEGEEMKSEDSRKEKKEKNTELQSPLDSPLSISRGGKLGLVSLECMLNCSLFFRVSLQLNHLNYLFCSPLRRAGIMVA